MTCPCLAICNILSQCPRPKPAYLSIQQVINPVRARGLALSTPGWTRIGHDPTRAGAFSTGEGGAWGYAGGRVQA